MGLKEELASLDNFTKFINNEIIKNRIKHLLIWYVKKATYYKYGYYILSVLIIVINASIPILNQLSWKHSTLVVSSVSGIASVIASVITLLNIKDTWFRYRKYVEILKKECMLFSCKSGDYYSSDREKIFIVNIENIISQERKNWESEKFKKDLKNKIK